MTTFTILLCFLFGFNILLIELFLDTIIIIIIIIIIISSSS